MYLDPGFIISNFGNGSKETNDKRTNNLEIYANTFFLVLQKVTILKLKFNMLFLKTRQSLNNESLKSYCILF